MIHPLAAQIQRLKFRDGDIPERTPFNIAIETAYNEAIADVLALLVGSGTPTPERQDDQKAAPNAPEEPKPERLRSRSARYVYVVEQGAYSDRGIVGVYDSPEAAMADHPLPANYRYPDPPTAANSSRRGGWQPCSYAEPGQAWSNGLDWGDGKDITRYEVEGVSERLRADQHDVSSGPQADQEPR